MIKKYETKQLVLDLPTVVIVRAAQWDIDKLMGTSSH